MQNRMVTQGFPKIVRSLTYLYFYIPQTSCALLAYPCVALVKEALAVTLAGECWLPEHLFPLMHSASGDVGRKLAILPWPK